MERLIRSNSASLSNRQLLVPRSRASILHAGRTPALSFSLSICKKMKKEKRRRQRLRTGSGAIEEVVRVIFARASFFEAENPSGKRGGGARKVARKGAKPRVPAEPRLNNSLVCREDARTVWFLELLGKCRRTSPTVSRARKTSPRVIRMACK